jgi:hypothetical protein
VTSVSNLKVEEGVVEGVLSQVKAYECRTQLLRFTANESARGERAAAKVTVTLCVDDLQP